MKEALRIPRLGLKMQLNLIRLRPGLNMPALKPLGRKFSGFYEDNTLRQEM